MLFIPLPFWNTALEISKIRSICCCCCFVNVLSSQSSRTKFMNEFACLGIAGTLILKNIWTFFPIAVLFSIPIIAVVDMHQMFETLTIFVFDFLEPQRLVRCIWSTFIRSGRFSISFTLSTCCTLFLLKPVEITVRK